MKDEHKSPKQLWNTVGKLTVSLAVVAGKARKAKGSSDLLVHADLIVGLAALLVVIAKVRRDAHEPTT